MIPAGAIIDELQTQMNDPRGTSDAVYKAQVWQKLNQAYREVAGANDWRSLRRTVEISEDEDDEGEGLEQWVLPADSRIVLRVWDGDKLEYNFAGEAEARSDYTRNWYYGDDVSEASESGITCAVAEYAKAVTSTAEFGSVDLAGEYIRIGANAGVYRIASWTDASNLTLADYFRGAAQSEVRFEIRPIGTRVIKFSDAARNDLDPGDVNVTYVRNALPLYKDEDVIELPGSCEAVGIQALRHLLAQAGFNQAADRKREDYVAALTAMRAAENQEPYIKASSMFDFSEYQVAQDHRWMRGLSLMNS